MISLEHGRRLEHSGMWILEKKFRFEASHILPHHTGKCARLHGHSWVGTIVCSGASLEKSGPRAGMVIDYTEMSEILKPIVEMYLDHHHLNDSLEIENPTSEAIAQWIFENVKPILPLLTSVIIEETCTARCIYIP